MPLPKDQPLSQYEFSDICIERAQQYVHEVQTGAVLVPGLGHVEVGELEYLAVQRYLNDMNNPAFTFDQNGPDRNFQFFSLLRHSKGAYAGTQFLLSPFQCFVNWNIFGFFMEREDEETGQPYLARRFRLAYIQIAKKNGKSTFCSGNGLYLLRYDNEPGAEVYCAATKRDQAKIVALEACNMVRQSPQLRRDLKVYKRTGRILFEAANAELNALGADADNSDGINPSAVVVDELHRHKNRNLWDILVLGIGARQNPLLWSITTAGDEPNADTNICYEQRHHAEQVVRGEIDDEEYFSFVAEPDPDDDWTDPKVWRKGNPNLGVNIKVKDIEADCRRAQQNPAAENSFKRLKLDMWTEQSVRWIPMDKWRHCPVGQPTISGKRCYGGLDLSATRDLTAFALVFPPQDGIDVLTVRTWFWCPEERVTEATQQNRVPYARWVRDGYLQKTDGASVDYDVMLADIERHCAMNNVQEIGFDPWNANATVNQMISKGFTMVEMRQGFGTLGAPTKALEKLVFSRAIDHGNNPVLNWCATNVAVREDDNENKAPTKAKSNGRIDGIVATIMALGRAMATEDDADSVYNDRGMLVIG